MTKTNTKSVQTVENTSTELEEFKPTAEMLLWADAAIQIADDSPTEVVKACAELFGLEIDRTTWYKWQKMNGFKQWWITRWEEGITLWKTKVDSLGWKFAKRGSPQHFDYLTKRVGNASDTPGVVQQFNNYGQLTDEQLESVIAAKIKEAGTSLPASGEAEQDQEKSA